MTTLIDGTTQVPDNGQIGWGSILNTAIAAIDGRFTYQSPTSIPATKALASGLTGTTLASNVVTSSLTTIGTLTSLTVNGNAIVSGNFTVNGTDVVINSSTLSITDNVITLNSDVTTGAPTENVGFDIRRGASATVALRWNETNDYWEYTNDGTIYLRIGNGAPVTRTSSFTLAATDGNVICNGTGTITVTLPAASSWTGREVLIKTIAAQTVVSNASNVVPLAGGAAGTAILANVAGRWARLVSDGTNWVIMAAN